MECSERARDAIAAMRVPTEGMVAAAGYKTEDLLTWMESHDWPVMIDAALAPPNADADKA